MINGKEEIADFLTSERVRRDQSEWQIAEKPELRIISDELFRRAGELMQSRRKMFQTGHQRQSNKHLFSTLIVCKYCGWSFRRVSRTYRNTYVRWVCSKHNGQGIHNCPNAVTVDEEELIACLDEYFLSLLKDRTHVDQGLRQKLRDACQQETDQDERRTAVQARLAKLEKQRQKFLDLYADDIITRQELDQKLNASKAELLRLEEELRQMQLHDLNDADIDRVIRRTMDHLKDFVSVKKLNNAQLKQLVEKIEVDEDGTVDVYLRLLQKQSG